MSHRLSGRLSGTAARASTPWRAVARSALLLWGIGLAATTALAQVSVNQVLFPSNIGRTLDATVSIDYTRTSAAAATISVAIPPQLSANPPAPPAGCVAVGSPAMQLDCSVPAGSTGSGGTITFDVRGATLGSFSLSAVGTGGSTATNPGTVRSSGEVTVSQTKSPSGNPLAGQTTVFSLVPAIAAGGDDLPSGAVLTITSQLPGTGTDFSVSGINGGIASCNSRASANTSRTVTCTLAGPLTGAQVNAVVITVTGTPGNSGNFVNVASVAADQSSYFDQNTNNNIASLAYTVDQGSDVQAQGSFIATSVVTGSTQNLTLTYRNNGPSNLPLDGTVSTTVPAGFRVNSLPAGCSGPATGVVLLSPAVLTCSTAAVTTGNTQSFVVPLTMPTAASAGNFTVTAAPPGGFGDANGSNNSISLPYQVTAAFADLSLAKSKAPAFGPVAPGDTLTTTLTLSNDNNSSSTAAFSANGGGTELRVIDYMRPEEIAGGVLAGVSAGWACVLANATDPTDSNRTRRVTCTRSSSGMLSPGASLAVSFQTTVASLVGQATLSNRACTGETALSELGLSPGQGPQPPGNGQAANDCATAGSSLVATEVVSGQAVVTVVKESSSDNGTWVDNPATPPTIVDSNEFMYWRIRISTPSGGSQKTIPTINLNDNLPAIINTTSPGAPAPGYTTPAIPVTTTVLAGSASGSCPNLPAAGSSLNCSFNGVTPGTTIQIVIAVRRPFGSGPGITNTATVTSPDAVLSGTLSDSAAVTVEPRVDLAATGKTVTPATPRIGQSLQFTVTAQNLGPDWVTQVGYFKIIDDLNTSTAGGAVAFTDIVPTGANMACAVAGSALSDEPALAANHVRVRCTNTGQITLYSTRSITITARVLKPATLPPSGNVYTAQNNTVRVMVPSLFMCEWKTETSTNGSVSTTCNDAASTSNNSRSVAFDVQVPQIDLQQRKTRVLPGSQTSFLVGQPLRYRLRIQNNGPSRAEGVQMTDRMTVPAGFTLSSPTLFNINGVAAESGYTLDTSKSSSLSCTQASANADLVCVLDASAANNWLDAGREVNFEVELVQTGASVAPVTFSNQALVCADETLGYESSGACDRNAPNNNNLASVNDVIFPRTDLSIAKTTVTPLPVSINQPVQYQLVVRNLGGNATQQVRVQDVLPPDFELVTSGANAPSLTLGSFVTAAPSTATGATLACTSLPAALTAAGQSQTVDCVINATPGPLGAGSFPGNSDANNTLTLRLHAVPKEPFFTGPFLSNRTNTATVSPGQDSGGSTLSIDSVPGNNSATSLVQVSNASVAGRVFNDRNGNGMQDGTTAPQDEGIGNVTLVLSGTDAYGNAVSRSTTSVNAVGATRGDYLFDTLPPGTYIVTQTQPAGWANSAGTPAAPSAGGVYTPAASASTSTYTAVTLPAATAATGYHFPEALPQAVISGTVFNDRDRSGVQNGSEPGLAGVSVGLYTAGTTCPASGALPGGALQTVLTTASGVYAFAAAVSGNSYVVCQQQPVGYGDRTPVPGTGNSTPGANQIDVALLAAGGSANNHYPEVAASLSGVVFIDFNASTPGTSNNGVPNAGEPGLGSATAGAGVPVVLTGTLAAGGAITPMTLTTAADGSYSFNDLLAGSYTVTEGAIPAALGTFNDGINTAGAVTGGGTAGTAGAVGDSAIRNVVLNGGASSAGNNFAELPRAGISGLVYLDRDRNGVLTAADPGRLPGVTIELRQGGSSCASATLLGSTSTAADGSYAFPGGSVTAAQVSTGMALRVCQVQPAPYADGSTNPGPGGSTSAPNEIVLASLPASGSANNNFGELPGSVAGSVYRDFASGTAANDDNGVRNAGEVGIAGVPVTLLNTGTGASVVASTDSNGDYVFNDLAAGSYSLTEGAIPPAAGMFANGRTTAGTLAGGTLGTAGNDTITAIALPAGGVSINNLFGELVPAGSISGTVYIDRDRDSQLTAADPGRLGGVTLRLVDGITCSGTLLASVQTDSAGAYAFSNATLTAPAQLAGGRAYSVCETQPAGYGEGTVNPGSGGTSPAINHILIVALPAGGSGNNNFGERGASLSGRVFLDAANDGVFNGSDSGIAGVALTLTGGSLPGAGATATTAADGTYRFDDLPAGSYDITEQAAQPVVSIGSGAVTTVNGQTRAGTVASAPSGTATPVATVPSAVRGIALPAGGDTVNNDFAEVLPASSLAGRVWLDANNNGLLDTTETGIAGVSIVLTGTDIGGTAVSQSMTTAADGSWRFDSLLPGTYTVTEPTQPTGTFNGATVPGSGGAGGGTATGTATVPSAITGIVVGPAQAVSGHLFGEIAPAQVSGSVYNDTNNDGVRQPGEAGYADQPIVLTGTDDQGQPVSLTTRTSPTGDFTFPTLRPGTYTVTQPNQPAGTDNGITTPGSSGGTATAVTSTPSAISGVLLTAGQSAVNNLFAERGSSADVVVTKTHSPATFTELNTGSYTLTVRNAGQVATSGPITVTDTLPAGITPLASTTAAPNPRGTGWTCSISGQVVTCSSSDVIAADSSSANPIVLGVTVARAACATFPCTLDNQVSVAGGGELPARAPTPPELANPPLCTTPLATQNACRRPTPLQQSGGVSGTVWLDVDHNRQLTAADVRLPGFIVELLLNGQMQRSTTTDARGDYILTGLVPGSGFEVRFKDPGTGAYYGRPVSADPSGGNDPTASGPASVVASGSIQNLSVPGGNTVRINQNLPLDPNGVVYDTMTRQPVAGALVELLTPAGDPVPTQCVLGGVNRVTTAITATNGVGVVPGGYAFWLANPQPAGCAGDGAYQLRVTPPTGYLNAGRASDGGLAFTSAMLPATSPLASVPNSCQGYVAGGACAIQSQAVPPVANQPTPYYFRLPLTPATPAAFVEIVNNHIPLDPFGGTRFVITKQAAARTAELGDTMRYTITVRHIDGPALPNVRVDDALPAGFRYIPGTFRLANTLQSDPAGGPGPKLGFTLGTLPVNGQITFTYFLRVGVGAQQGDGINTAQGVSVSGALQVLSNIARAQVKVTGGVFSNEACVLGKVFVDCNGNMVQDREELGIPGVRLFLQDGTGITTDSEGKYSFCGLPPRTHVLKVDALTLPRGSRLVTSSSRNAGDANSIFLEPRNGELHRADFIEGSCSNTVLEQVKARRAQGEVRAVESEAKGTPALKFEGKAPGYPQEGTDSANQPPVKPRVPGDAPPPAPVQASRPEQNVPVPQLPAASQNTQRK